MYAREFVPGQGLWGDAPKNDDGPALPPGVAGCVEIKILRRVRAESSRRPPRHRRDACSMAWRYWFLTARPSQDGRVIAENPLSEELCTRHTG
jgi:hypothetical protein